MLDTTIRPGQTTPIPSKEAQRIARDAETCVPDETTPGARIIDEGIPMQEAPPVLSHRFDPHLYTFTAKVSRAQRQLEFSDKQSFELLLVPQTTTQDPRPVKVRVRVANAGRKSIELDPELWQFEKIEPLDPARKGAGWIVGMRFLGARFSADLKKNTLQQTDLDIVRDETKKLLDCQDADVVNARVLLRAFIRKQTLHFTVQLEDGTEIPFFLKLDYVMRD